jgi:hypothetical protein
MNRQQEEWEELSRLSMGIEPFVWHRDDKIFALLVWFVIYLLTGLVFCAWYFLFSAARP